MALLLFVCVFFWGAHKSLAPRARTLLGCLGQATLSFFAVATLLSFFFCECPKFCDLAKQQNSPGATLHAHPAVLGIRHAQKPTSSGGDQGHPIHPASPDPNPTPQHPTRLHHIVGISRPKQPHPPNQAPPPRPQHHRAPPSRDSGSRPGGGPWRPRANNTWSKTK